MARIKKFEMFNEAVDVNSPEWLPSDFDFVNYVEKNIPLLAKRILVQHDIKHVADLLEMLAKAYSGEKTGSKFIGYLLSENYEKALIEADDVNKISIWVYVLFQINKVPTILRDKFKVK